MRTKVFFDIETTGLDEEKDEIHQISVKCGKKELNYYLRFKTPPSHDLPIPFDVRRVIMEDALIGIFEFVKKTADMADPPNKDGKRQGLTFAGKNPLFDWKFLMKQKLFKVTWDKFFHYNLFDLTAIIYFLKDLGIILHDQSTKLEELVKYFQLKIDGNPHDSLFDVRATYEIYEVAKKLVLEKKVRASSKQNKDREKFIELIINWYPHYTKKQITDALNSGFPPRVPVSESPLTDVIIKGDIRQGEGLGKKKPKKKSKKKPFQRKEPGV